MGRELCWCRSRSSARQRTPSHATTSRRTPPHATASPPHASARHRAPLPVPTLPAVPLPLPLPLVPLPLPRRPLRHRGGIGAAFGAGGRSFVPSYLFYLHSILFLNSSLIFDIAT